MKVWYGDARATRRSALVVIFRDSLLLRTPLKSLRVGSLTQKIKVYVSRGRHECGSRAGEALAGVADRVREQQSPERACARERGRAWFCVAKRPGAAGVATD